MAITQLDAPAGTVIRLDGAFDRAAAARLQALVDDVAESAALTLDFREVRLFHDSAITSLADALARHPDARLVGLSEHQYRLLRYVNDPSARHV
jgi:hypothetical protein